MTDNTEFTPTKGMRNLKGSFWYKVNNDFLLHAKILQQGITPALVQKVTGKSSVSVWWYEEGFQEWFKVNNITAVDEQIGNVVEHALSDLQSVLALPTTEKTATAKIKAIQLAMEIGGRLAKGKLGKENIPKLGAKEESLAALPDATLERIADGEIIEESDAE